MMYTYDLITNGDYEILDLDSKLRDAIDSSGVKRGFAIIYCPHTTAAITINENGDPDVKRDMIEGFKVISPERKSYKHFEGNSHAHILSSLVGVSEQILIEDSRPVLGTWQSVYFCEFDGPRRRRVHIRIVRA